MRLSLTPDTGNSGRELPAEAFALGAIFPALGSAACTTVIDRLNRTATQRGRHFFDMVFFLFKKNSRRRDFHCQNIVPPAKTQGIFAKDLIFKAVFGPVNPPKNYPLNGFVIFIY
jgi:hypothetical protein